MPLPEKRDNEGEREFMRRCLQDKNIQKEFKGRKQQLAYCIKEARGQNQKEDSNNE